MSRLPLRRLYGLFSAISNILRKLCGEYWRESPHFPRGGRLVRGRVGNSAGRPKLSLTGLAGLPGAGCPGGGRRDICWRCREARDRIEPSLKTWREPRWSAERRARPPKAARAATSNTSGAPLGSRKRGYDHALFGAPPPSSVEARSCTSLE